MKGVEEKDKRGGKMKEGRKWERRCGRKGRRRGIKVKERR